MLRKSLPIPSPLLTFITALDRKYVSKDYPCSLCKNDIMISAQMKRKPVTGLRIHQRIEAKVILCTKTYQ